MLDFGKVIRTQTRRVIWNNEDFLTCNKENVLHFSFHTFFVPPQTKTYPKSWQKVFATLAKQRCWTLQQDSPDQLLITTAHLTPRATLPSTQASQGETIRQGNPTACAIQGIRRKMVFSEREFLINFHHFSWKCHMISNKDFFWESSNLLLGKVVEPSHLKKYEFVKLGSFSQEQTYFKPPPRLVLVDFLGGEGLDWTLLNCTFWRVGSWKPSDWTWWFQAPQREAT